MKRIVSVFLSFLLLCSTFTFVSANSVSNMTQAVSNPLEMELAVQTLAREAGEGSYASTLELLSPTLSEGVGVDYKTTLNMEPVRRLFESGFIQLVVATDPQAKAEFDAGIVSTEVKVVITYPKKATVKANLQTAGVLDAGSIFSEASRVVEPDKQTVTITFKNTDALTVAELLQNVGSYLKDISFTLEDGLAYSENGYYNVSVALTGTTSIIFSSKTQQITYTGSASHITSAGQTHILEVVPAEPATCDEKGWTEGVRCATHISNDSGYGCGANGIVRPTKTIAALNHRENGKLMTKEIPHQAATCTAEGVLGHWFCMFCKKDFADKNATDFLEPEEIVLAKVAHTRREKPGVAATCTTDGLTAGAVCDVCGYSIESQKRIPATGHSEVTIPAIAPTCTEAGKTEGKKCSVCSTILLEQQPIAPTGHSFGDWSVVTPAEEGKTGLKERECSVCHTKETAVIPALVHVCKVDPKLSVITKNPTCTDAGKVQEYCGCGKEVGAPKTVPAIGHKTTEIAGRAATCTEKGILRHFACENCMLLFRDAACKNPIQSAEIPVDRNAHPEGKKRILAAVAPTCTSDGLTEGEKCFACNIVTKPQKNVENLHAFDAVTGKPVYATFEDILGKNPTCEASGSLEHWHCAICSKDYAMDKVTELTVSEWTLAPLGHNFGDVQVTLEPSETTEGAGFRECSSCSERRNVVIARKEHVHTEKAEEIIKPATCTEDGENREIYTCCGEVVAGKESIRIPAKGHTLKKINEVKEDCFNEGKKVHWFCTTCEKRFLSASGKVEVDENGLKIGKRTHEFVKSSETETQIINKCKHPGCDETIIVPKSETAKVVGHGGIKDKADKTKEARANEKKETTKVEVQILSNINIEERQEISEKLESEVFEKEKASENKLVMDIVIEKVTIYSSTENAEELDRDKELVPETEDLVTIELTIPENMRNLVDFVVHRLHEDQNGQTQTDVIKLQKNADGEYIEISADKTKVTLHVKKFSEYALVGYNEVVNTPEDDFQPSGSKVSQYTVKFNTNGGTVVDSIKVKLGSTITPPVTKKEGYELEGWYTDVAMTKRFDFSTRISANLTLYAKWVERTGCDGTEADNCPSLVFSDVDTSLWYHEGIDFVVENGYMIGVSKTSFAPDINLSRAMLVTTLWRMEGEPAANSANPFADVEADGYYTNAVAWAAENGIVTGYSEDAFGPHDLILREQMAAIIYRYASFKGVDVSPYADTNILSYTDYADVSEYAISALQYTVGSGLIKGRTATTLNPTATATRAETATILYRFVSMQK